MGKNLCEEKETTMEKEKMEKREIENELGWLLARTLSWEDELNSLIKEN